jgi:hypothetical protein
MPVGEQEGESGSAIGGQRGKNLYSGCTVGIVPFFNAGPLGGFRRPSLCAACAIETSAVDTAHAEVFDLEKFLDAVF